MEELKTGLTVKTTKKVTIDDYLVDDLLVRNRRNTEDSVIDSPIHLNYNKLWLVKHSKSKLIDGISVGFYAVYHESEMEIVDVPAPTKELLDDVFDDDFLLNY